MPDPVPIPEGYAGNLTTIQQEKLLQFWKIIQQSWDSSLTGPDTDATSLASAGSKTRTHRRFFSFSRSATQPLDQEISAIPPNLLVSLKRLGAGPNDLKAIHSLLTKLPGENLRTAFLAMLKQDHPDALCLRFLRAEKWDVPKAWIKLVRSLNWRVNEYHVDEEVLMKGEGYAMEKSTLEENSTEKKDGEGFMLQLNTGKGHFHGADRDGRPICIVRVRTHQPGTQTAKGLNDYIVQCIETVRILMVSPVESMAIVFDLTSFSLSNWELAPVKFIIDCFQENYPESLGAMIFYNAPWIFSGFWKIIYGLLDPVVASKVHFISGAKELETLVAPEHIIKELGGEEDWEWEYIEPRANENEKLRDATTRSTILEERNKLADDLFRLNAKWITSSHDELWNEQRDSVIKQLSENYWKLDPYVRARTVLDRTGVIQEGGKIDFYPTQAPKTEPQSEVEVEVEVQVEPKVIVEETNTAQVAAVTA
ncbi:uncharacterized protein N7483_012016 [Penicillium malachiteum]|uniref:uncharacterized protein n=1 Tax=Penicillium malachiteum TaxID=1324776 RepID=UPI00254794F0|nr:uncharacterized protein N7483_012016 [Penicillium malachiteum]KAJ5714835.1 hypothetical protein N7483_012016 [Penicillium malachiteum]